MSDEAPFDLSGGVNKQNCRFSAGENPHILHQRGLHPKRVTVWCAVASNLITGPYIFFKKIMQQCYLNMLQKFFLPQMQNKAPVRNMWFQ
jgi:hypothetical protein